jgi:hypothetical protein
VARAGTVIVNFACVADAGAIEPPPGEPPAGEPPGDTVDPPPEHPETAMAASIAMKRVRTIIESVLRAS